MSDFSRQCILQKPIVNGVMNQITWIPEEFAVVGKPLRLKEGDAWDDGWIVIGVGARKPANEDRSRHHLKHRKGTDV